MNVKRLLRTVKIVLVAIVAISILSSCEKMENMYSSHYAYFTYQPVSATPNLFRACTSLGEFCSITFPPGDRYIIKNPSTPSVEDYILRTALQGYGGFRLGLNSGLIIGMPIIPEMMQQQSQVVCFDLCCSNCYKDYHLTKPLQMSVGGEANCLLCKRVYDLNNSGIVSDGPAGHSLFRYYVNYYSPTQKITVSNR